MSASLLSPDVAGGESCQVVYRWFQVLLLVEKQKTLGVGGIGGTVVASAVATW